MEHMTLLTEFQVFEIFGIQPKTLANWRCSGRGPAFVKIGGHVRYRPQDLKTFLDSRVFASTSDYAVFRSEDQRERSNSSLPAKQ